MPIADGTRKSSKEMAGAAKPAVPCEGSRSTTSNGEVKWVTILIAISLPCAPIATELFTGDVARASGANPDYDAESPPKGNAVYCPAFNGKS